MTAFVFDRVRKASPQAGPRIIPMPVEPRARPRPRRGRGTGSAAAPFRSLIADLCLFALRLSGWMALTLLATLGLYTLFFMALGGFGAEGFFAHLANLATRYGEADAGRQAQFVRQLALTTLVLFLAVSAARYRSLVAVFSAPSGPRKD